MKGKILRRDPDTIYVSLSRRNLVTLLAKLDGEPAGSQCTLERVCENGTAVIVKAEPDDQHYQGRIPGRMHPDTEAAIKPKLERAEDEIRNLGGIGR